MAKCPGCEQHELKRVKTKRGEMLACNGGKVDGKQLGCGFWGPLYKKKAQDIETPEGAAPKIVAAPVVAVDHPASTGPAKRTARRKAKRVSRESERVDSRASGTGTGEPKRKGLLERINGWL